MVTGQNQWDIDLINDIFNVRDADLILSIPLRQEDAYYWFQNKEKMGVFTVKSAYRAMRDQQVPNTSQNISNVWKKMWVLKLPPKVKHFIWRALSGCLPTKENLQMRRVQVISSCPVCNNEQETVWHSLVNCQFAGLCWPYVKPVTKYKFYTVANLGV